MRLSVIIPVHNRASLLPRTLRSLLRQSVPADEIIVVDDGSTDGTSEAARRMGPPIRVIIQKKQGPGAARNRGLAEALGEWVHFFDSDDLALPDKHAVQLESLERTGADIAYGPWVKGCFESQTFRASNHVLQQNGLPEGDLVKHLLTDWSIIPHAGLYRRDLALRTGGFPEDLSVAEDQMFFLSGLLAGARVTYTPGSLVLYRNDNADKLSSGNQGRERHFVHWARFLVQARAACREAGRDPAAWSGFRRRCWAAERDLAQTNSDHKDLIQNLQRIRGRTEPGWWLSLCTTLGQKKGGLQQRLTGGRANASFKASKLTRWQQEQADQTLRQTLGKEEAPA